MKFGRKVNLANLLLFMGSQIYTPIALGEGQDERFKDVEIRVIRPKYFTKRKHFELGADFSVVTNQTFIYTYLLTGNATFHLTETIGLEGSASYGFSIDKSDKKVLDTDFSIKTEILRTKYLLDGSILWAPIYGKYQLASGRLIYFDTFLIGGLGMSGIEYKYDNCLSPLENGAAEADKVKPPSPTTRSYMAYIWGLGQRYFINKNTSLKWSVRGHSYNTPNKDGSCDPESDVSGSSSRNDILIQLGASKYF
jgi:outer membrane beta-barrel protein